MIVANLVKFYGIDQQPIEESFAYASVLTVALFAFPLSLFKIYKNATAYFIYDVLYGIEIPAWYQDLMQAKKVGGKANYSLNSTIVCAEILSSSYLILKCAIEKGDLKSDKVVLGEMLINISIVWIFCLTVYYLICASFMSRSIKGQRESNMRQIIKSFEEELDHDLSEEEKAFLANLTTEEQDTAIYSYNANPEDIYKLNSVLSSLDIKDENHLLNSLIEMINSKCQEEWAKSKC